MVMHMRKYYFIDSENVGDSWVSLLYSITSEDELLVFYTKNSPHMNYKNVIQLKQSSKDVTFIECCEGNNALDFQLSTYLGFHVHANADNEFIIVSNDTGFDAVVKFWNSRDIKIIRISGAVCISKLKPQETLTNLEKLEKDTLSSTDNSSLITTPNIDESAKEILYCIGKTELSSLHNAIITLYGEKRGKTIYNAFKSDSSFTNYLNKHKAMNQKEKQNLYCSIIFEKNNTTMPTDFPMFVMDAWKKKKNLNSLRAALQTKYGTSIVAKYYEIIKAHIKILDKIK